MFLEIKQGSVSPHNTKKHKYNKKYLKLNFCCLTLTQLVCVCDEFEDDEEHTGLSTASHHSETTENNKNSHYSGSGNNCASSMLTLT